jgi:hypothetical protein
MSASHPLRTQKRSTQIAFMKEEDEKRWEERLKRVAKASSENLE